MRILSFLLILTGALFIWMIKGFKGKFDNEMVSTTEVDWGKEKLRLLTGLGIWTLIIAIASVFISRSGSSNSYEVETNENGEVIELKQIK